ncbi:MAG: hypothetical protein ACRDVE_00015 [Actinocrinis sp.]
MSPAATPEADQADLIRRMAATLAADAEARGVNLTDPATRLGFDAGLAVALGLVVSARETGQADSSSASFLEDMLTVAIASLRPEADSAR